MKNKISHIYTATSLQQGFTYHSLCQRDDDAYRVQVLHDYHESIDVDRYVEAWQLYIEQYPILRTDLLSSLHWYYHALLQGQQVSIKEDTAGLEAQEYIGNNKMGIILFLIYNRCLFLML